MGIVFFCNFLSVFLRKTPMNGYILGTRIGKGTYGQVYSGLSPSGDKVAMKKIAISPSNDSVFLLYRELSVLRAVGTHPNVISVLDVVVGKPDCASVWIVSPLYESDLRTFVKSNCPNYIVTEPLLTEILSQLIEGLSHIHNLHILHRDIKPQNVLVISEPWPVKTPLKERNRQQSKKIRVVIADLGLSKFVVNRLPRFGYDACTHSPAMTHEIVTLWYRAPEVILGATTYCGAIDVWSLAVVLVELASGKCPFNGKSEVDTLMKIFQIVGTPQKDSVFGTMKYFSSRFPLWSPAACASKLKNLMGESKYVHIAASMLALEPKDRPTIDSVKRWLNGRRRL